MGSDEDIITMRDEVISTMKIAEVLISGSTGAVITIRADFEFCNDFYSTGFIPVIIGNKTKPEGLSITESEWILYMVTEKELDSLSKNIYFCKASELKQYIRSNYGTLKKKRGAVLLDAAQFKIIFKRWDTN